MSIKKLANFGRVGSNDNPFLMRNKRIQANMIHTQSAMLVQNRPRAVLSIWPFVSALTI